MCLGNYATIRPEIFPNAFKKYITASRTSKVNYRTRFFNLSKV